MSLAWLLLAVLMTASFGGANEVHEVRTTEPLVQAVVPVLRAAATLGREVTNDKSIDDGAGDRDGAANNVSIDGQISVGDRGSGMACAVCGDDRRLRLGSRLVLGDVGLPARESGLATEAPTVTPVIRQPQVYDVTAPGDLEMLICAYSWPCSEAVSVAACESGTGKDGRLDESLKCWSCAPWRQW